MSHFFRRDVLWSAACCVVLGANFASVKAQNLAERAPAFATSLTPDDLDANAFAFSSGAIESKEGLPLKGPTHANAATFVMWTGQSRPEWSGVEFGASKTPGARHLRIGFHKTIPIGSLLVRGNVSVSVLKTSAIYPGKLNDATQWTSAQRLSGREVFSKAGKSEELALWNLPPGTQTRAIRFTGVSNPNESRYVGWLGGVWLLPNRFANLAPQAQVIVSSNEKFASRLNDQMSNTFSDWSSGDENAPNLISPQNAPTIVLAWPQKVKLRGLSSLFTGFGSAQVQTFVGPSSRHPRQAAEADWQTLGDYQFDRSGYPLPLYPHWMDFGRDVSTRAVRLKLTSVTREDHGHLNNNTRNGKRVWLGELMALSPLGASQLRTAVLPLPTREKPPIAVRFTLPEAGYVSLVIEGMSGKRVRNLVSETLFPKGANVVYWDGTNDLGRDMEAATRGIYNIPAQFVTPGTYRVRGLYRKALDLRYQFSIYNPGTPAWETSDKSGGWTTNHTPPSSVLFSPQTLNNKPAVLIGSYVAEGGAGLAWTDLNGRKWNGSGHVGGNWTGAPYLARAMGEGWGDVYAFVAAAWQNELRLTSLHADGSQRPTLASSWKFDPALPLDAPVIPDGVSSGISGVAARSGIVVVSMSARNSLLFLNARTRLPLGEVAVDSPRGVSFDAQGRLLVLSASSLKRVTLPDDLSAFLDSSRGTGASISRVGWKATASREEARASLVLDGDNKTRWDTARGMKAGDWFALDLGQEQTLGALLMENTGSDGDYARGFEVFVSADGTNWGQAITRGVGSGERTLVSLPQTKARHVKIVQTGQDADRHWSLNEIQVLQAPSSAAPQALPWQTLVQNLQDPQGITTDARGQIYISEWGTSHGVKCFDESGKYLHRVGKSGAPKAGKYDELQMSNPRGLSIDANNRLWVAEEHHQPKRVSVWNADRTLWKAFYGPSAYGGGGTIDVGDKNRFLYNGMEFSLDWKSGTNKLSNVYFRPEDNGGETPPEAAIYLGTRRYLTNSYNSNPTNGVSFAGLWQMMPNGIARAAALAGSANDSPMFKALARSSTDFSARYTGQIKSEKSGEHTFYLTAADNVRLWINGQKLVDTWDGSEIQAARIELSANRRTDIKIEFRQRGGGARLRLEWQGPDTPRQIVPASALFPDIRAATPAGGLQARYFESPDLWDYNNRHASAVEGPIDFDWSQAAPKAFSTVDVSPFVKRLPTNYQRGQQLSFGWNDLSGDGIAQPNEVTFLNGKTQGVIFGPDGSITFALFGDDQKGFRSMRFKPLRFAAKGAPIYDFAKGQILVKDAQGSPSTGGVQVLAGSDGWSVHSNAPKPFSPAGPGGVKNGVPLWSYPDLWPGLHASHDAPAPDRPGMLIGTTRLLGPLVTPKLGQAGPLWFVNGNMGNIFVMTQDGLFVAELFHDVRQAPLWAMPVGKREMRVNDLSLHDENFWPSVAQTPDGQIILNSSLPNIVRIDGLESVRRIAPTPLVVSANDLKKAQSFFVRAELQRQSERGGGKMQVVMRAQAPQVDGKLDEWDESSWVEIDRRGQEGYFQSNARAYNTRGAISVSGDQLFAAWKTDEANLLRNSGEMPNAPFKTGGALDIMLGTDSKADPKRTTPVAGDLRLLVTRIGEGPNAKTRALIYRAVVPNFSGERVPFSSPWRTVSFDAVEDVSDRVQLAQDGGNYEISIPLSLLKFSPQTGANFKGDIGVLRGNNGQTTARVYWSNKATGITADVPSEAQLMPQLWGDLQLQAP